MPFIQNITLWEEIPSEIPVSSFEEIDGLLCEMKPLFAHTIGPTYWTEKWYAASLWKLGYRNFGTWFFDSLIQVNQILRQEYASGIFRVISDNVGRGLYNGRQLARVYGDCYRFPEGAYAYRLCVSFWEDAQHESLVGDYDLTEMLDDWCWIAKSLGLLPGRYEEGEK